MTGSILHMQPQSDREPNKIVAWLAQHTHLRILLFEFVASAFLVFMCESCLFFPDPLKKNPFALVYISVIIYMVTCWVGPLSGAHFNPSVTLGFFAQGKQHHHRGGKMLLLSYITAQVVGCLVGALLSRGISGMGGPVYESFDDVERVGKDFVEELAGSFILVSFLLMVTHEETTFVEDEAWTHLLVGFFYFLSMTFSTHLKYLNPAVILALQLEGMIHSGGAGGGLPAVLVIVAGDLLAAWLSQLFFTHVYLRVTRAWKKQLS